MKSHDEIDIWAKEILDNREIPFEESDWLAAQNLLQQNGYAKPPKFWTKFWPWTFVCLCVAGIALFAWNLKGKEEITVTSNTEISAKTSTKKLLNAQKSPIQGNTENTAISNNSKSIQSVIPQIDVMPSLKQRSPLYVNDLRTTETKYKQANKENTTNINNLKSIESVPDKISSTHSKETKAIISATVLRTMEMNSKQSNTEYAAIINYSPSMQETVAQTSPSSSSELNSETATMELRTLEIKSQANAEVVESKINTANNTKNISTLSLQSPSLSYIFATMPPIQAGKIEKGMARWALSSYCGMGFSSLSPAPYLGIMSEYRVHPFLKVQIFAELLERKVHNQQVDINPISASNYTPDLTNTYIPTQGLALIAQEKITRNALYYAAYGAGIALPLRRHEVFVSGAYCKLIGTQSQREISIYENSQLLEQKTSKEGGFTKGLNVNDITLGLGYRFALTRRLQLEISAQKGFKDISNDNFYQNAIKQTAFQVRTGLKYNLF